MFSLSSPRFGGRRKTGGGNGDAEEDQENAERSRQEARAHMHQGAGPIARAFERDAEAEQ